VPGQWLNIMDTDCQQNMNGRKQPEEIPAGITPGEMNRLYVNIQHQMVQILMNVMLAPSLLDFLQIRAVFMEPSIWLAMSGSGQIVL